LELDPTATGVTLEQIAAEARAHPDRPTTSELAREAMLRGDPPPEWWVRAHSRPIPTVQGTSITDFSHLQDPQPPG
jgi:hypothetical protein